MAFLLQRALERVIFDVIAVNLVVLPNAFFKTRSFYKDKLFAALYNTKRETAFLEAKKESNSVFWWGARKGDGGTICFEREFEEVNERMGSCQLEELAEEA